MLREMLASEIWLSKAGSTERGEGWKKLADLLNRMERVKFDVSARSVREHFQVLYEKRRAKNREEELASGIAPDELTENETILDELISLFDSAANEYRVADKEKADRAAVESSKAQEMRQQSLETFGETRKRKNGGEGVGSLGSGKKVRNTGKDTISLLRDRITAETEFRRKELELKERELAENIKAREHMNREKEKSVGSGNEIANLARCMEQMQYKIQTMHEMLKELLQKQQQQHEMMISIIRQLNYQKDN